MFQRGPDFGLSVVNDSWKKHGPLHETIEVKCLFVRFQVFSPSSVGARYVDRLTLED